MRFSRVQKVNFIPTITLNAVKRTAQYVFGDRTSYFQRGVTSALTVADKSINRRELTEAHQIHRKTPTQSSLKN